MMKPVPIRLIIVPRTYKAYNKHQIKYNEQWNHTLAKMIVAPKVSIIVPIRLSTKPPMQLEENISS
jgi:hypothetical protein